MKEDLTREEKNLLRAKTPASYIDKSLHSKITSGRKATLTRIWLDRTGFTVEDIKYARNRHPYWKGKKMEGTSERNQLRFEEHDYSTGKKIEWTDKRILRFIESNAKDKEGNYKYKDWQLAKRFKTTIAGVQHMRRKHNMAEKIITAKMGRVTDKRLLEYLKYGENVLRAMTKKLK